MRTLIGDLDQTQAEQAVELSHHGRRHLEVDQAHARSFFVVCNLAWRSACSKSRPRTSTMASGMSTRSRIQAPLAPAPTRASMGWRRLSACTWATASSKEAEICENLASPDQGCASRSSTRPTR
jgi:hypothetical protein